MLPKKALGQVSAFQAVHDPSMNSLSISHAKKDRLISETV